MIIFPIIGILALVWFLIRTGLKQGRAVYPCQRAAAGIGVTFLTFLAGILGSLACFQTLKNFFNKFPRAALAAFPVLCVGAGIMTSPLVISFTSLEVDRNTNMTINPAAFMHANADTNCDSGVDIVDALLFFDYDHGKNPAHL